MITKQEILSYLSLIKKSFLHLVYPSRCLHCETLLPPEPVVLCGECALLLEMIDPDDRCPTCFNYLFESFPICESCAQYPSLFSAVASVFNYEGPASSLVKRLKFSNHPYLARGMAGFLVTQFEILGWPMPDVLVPVPIPFSRWLERGYNQSALLAQEMSQLLKCPVWSVLKRKSGDFSQSLLNAEQRKKLSGQCFHLRSQYSLEGKNVLLIDDVLTSGLTLQRCSETLWAGNPASLYGLTFCRTVLL